MVFTTEGFLEVARKLALVEFEPLTTEDTFRCSNKLNYQAMSSTRTQSQLCTGSPISSLCSVFMFHFDHCLSGLRRYTENWKDPGLNPTRCSVGLWDPTWLFIYMHDGKK